MTLTSSADNNVGTGTDEKVPEDTKVETISHVLIAPQPTKHYQQFQKSTDDGITPNSKRDRRPKVEKDERRLVNARTIGRGIPEPHPGYVPQVSQLRHAALERCPVLSCNSWNREKLIAWLQANGQTNYSNLGINNEIAMRFLWSNNLEARLVCVICDDPTSFLSQDLKLDSDILSQYWFDAALKFNDESFQPINPFHHISQLPKLAALNPTPPPVTNIDENGLKDKFIEILNNYKMSKEESEVTVYIQKPENIPAISNFEFETDTLGPCPDGANKRMKEAAHEIKECIDLVGADLSIDQVLKDLEAITAKNEIQLSLFVWDIILHGTSMASCNETMSHRVHRLRHGQSSHLFSKFIFDRNRMLDSIAFNPRSYRKHKLTDVGDSHATPLKMKISRIGDSSKGGLKNRGVCFQKNSISEEEMLRQMEQSLRQEIIKLWQTKNDETDEELKKFIEEEIEHLKSELDYAKAKKKVR